MLHIQVAKLDHVAIQVPNVGETMAWYQRVLGLKQVHPGWGHNPAMMVTEAGTGIALFRQGSVEPHIAFSTDMAGFIAARSALIRLGIQFDYEDHGPTESLYFRDLNGKKLEITRPR